MIQGPMLQNCAWDLELQRAAIGPAARGASMPTRHSAAAICNRARLSVSAPVIYREPSPAGRTERANAQSLSRALGLDLVPDHGRHVGAAEVLHCPDAGRRGDVDLGEVAVD